MSNRLKHRINLWLHGALGLCVVALALVVLSLVEGCATQTQPFQGQGQDQASQGAEFRFFIGDNRNGSGSGIPQFLASNGFASATGATTEGSTLDAGRAANLNVVNFTITNGSTGAEAAQTGTQDTTARFDPETGFTTSIPVAAGPASQASGGSPATATGGGTASPTATSTQDAQATIYNLKAQNEALRGILDSLLRAQAAAEGQTDPGPLVVPTEPIE